VRLAVAALDQVLGEAFDLRRVGPGVKRAHNRVVSTSSADMTQAGCFLKSEEPGEMPKRAFLAPMYSRFSTSRRPMWESNPDSSDRWIASGSASLACCSRSRVLQAFLSWLCRSCHSRTLR